MPPAVRQQDICTGHPPCYPPRPNVTWSGDVFINGLGAHRQTDAWAPHGVALCPPHKGSTAAGSPNVFVNGLPLARVGDPIDCGSLCAVGSPNVFVNGPGEPLNAGDLG